MASALARALVGVVCGLSVGAGSSNSGPERVVVAHAAFPVSVVLAPDGGFVYGERLTGRVRRVSADGVLADDPVAQIDVSTGGQRGLLGVALDGDGRVFAAWTAPDKRQRIEVGEVAPSVRAVWHGPPSARRANGGHLVYDAADGSLVVGIGDLEEHRRVDDLGAPNGKLLRLRPERPAEQQPVVVSAGWNNPFAFTFTTNGALWVADNAPGDHVERLARGDVAGHPTRITALPADTVPSALTATRGGGLIVCSFLRQRTLRYELVGGRAVRSRGSGDGARCATSVAATEQGLLLADETEIRALMTSA